MTEDDLEVVRRDRLHALVFDLGGVYGSPGSKVSTLIGLAEDLSRPPAALLMGGDAMADLEAAVAAGPRFVGFVRDHGPFPAGTAVVHDLRQLLDVAQLAGGRRR